MFQCVNEPLCSNDTQFTKMSRKNSNANIDSIETQAARDTSTKVHYEIIVLIMYVCRMPSVLIILT